MLVSRLSSIYLLTLPKCGYIIVLVMPYRGIGYIFTKCCKMFADVKWYGLHKPRKRADGNNLDGCCGITYSQGMKSNLKLRGETGG